MVNTLLLCHSFRRQPGLKGLCPLPSPLCCACLMPANGRCCTPLLAGCCRGGGARAVPDPGGLDCGSLQVPALMAATLPMTATPPQETGVQPASDTNASAAWRGSHVCMQLPVPGMLPSSGWSAARFRLECRAFRPQRDSVGSAALPRCRASTLPDMFGVRFLEAIRCCWSSMQPFAPHWRGLSLSCSRVLYSKAQRDAAMYVVHYTHKRTACGLTSVFEPPCGSWPLLPFSCLL